jgi:hypothetical protein
VRCRREGAPLPIWVAAVIEMRLHSTGQARSTPTFHSQCEAMSATNH